MSIRPSGRPQPVCPRTDARTGAAATPGFYELPPVGRNAPVVLHLLPAQSAFAERRYTVSRNDSTLSDRDITRPHVQWGRAP
jgi:hypothetical protein